MIRCAVLGVVLVGCKICPSGIPLEDTTDYDGQNTTKSTSKIFSILSRHLLLPLETLVERDNHARQPDRAGSGRAVTADGAVTAHEPWLLMGRDR